MGKITAIILAAGLSSRMKGTFKLTLAFKNHTILEEVVVNILNTKISELIVVTGHCKEQTTALLKKYPSVKYVHNEDYELGMTSSIQCGVRNASPESDGYLICLGDLPYISTKEYLQIINTFLALDKEAAKIVRPYHKDIPGNPVLFSNDFKEEMLGHKNVIGCKDIIKSHPSALHKIQMKTDSVLKDIDTPLEYKILSKS